MIYVIDQHNAAFCQELLDAMHQMRYRVAVEQWRWNIPDIEPGYDKDRYDNRQTKFFLKIRQGEVVATARLNPCNNRYLISDVFPEFCDLAPPPTDSESFELSRFLIDRSRVQGRNYIMAAYEILAAVNEFALEQKIKRLVWLAYQITYNASLEVWDTRPLGIPRSHKDDQSVYVAATSPMTTQGLSNIRHKIGLREGRICHYPKQELKNAS